LFSCRCLRRRERLEAEAGRAVMGQEKRRKKCKELYSRQERTKQSSPFFPGPHPRCYSKGPTQLPRRTNQKQPFDVRLLLVPEPSKISTRDGTLFRLGHHHHHHVPPSMAEATDTRTRKGTASWPKCRDSLSFSIPIPERGATCYLLRGGDTSTCTATMLWSGSLALLVQQASLAFIHSCEFVMGHRW
jgi:hypothetical protein